MITAIGILLDNRPLGFIGLFGFTFLSMVFMALKPRWLEPSWMSWLRDHFDRPTLEFLFTQARNDRAWDSKVTNQQELEVWAREMAERFRPREEGLFWHGE